MTMTTALPATPRRRAGVQNAARSEILKVLTLRSTAITVGFTVAATLVITALVAHSAIGHGLNSGWYQGFDATQESLTGMIVAALTGGVFGALLITGEYSSGTMRTTLTATPRRQALLAAKLGITAVVTAVFCELLSFASFWLGQAILHGGAPSVSIGAPGALRAVTLTGLFVALLALMSFGLGLVLRNTPGAISAFAGIVFVLPLMMHAISQSDVRFLPTNILLNSIMSTVHQGGGPFGPVSPAVGLLLMAVYAAIPLVAGVVLFMRRDA